MNNKRKDYKYLLLIAMMYVTFSVSADVVAFKFSIFFSFIESGATIIFPLTYVLSDITTEVYGWNNAIKIVWFGLISESIFAIIILVVINLPNSQNVGMFQGEYTDILGNMWLFVLAGVISNAFAGILNVFFISKWKVRLNGKYFWLRSIVSTLISEFVLILLTVSIAFLPFIHLKETIQIFWSAYALEILYAIVLSIPAQLVVIFLKNKEKIDIFDVNVKYNPFRLES